MIVSAGVFGYTLNKISRIFDDMMQKKKNLLQDINLICDYLKDRDISESL